MVKMRLGRGDIGHPPDELRVRIYELRVGIPTVLCTVFEKPASYKSRSGKLNKTIQVSQKPKRAHKAVKYSVISCFLEAVQGLR